MTKCIGGSWPYVPNHAMRRNNDCWMSRFGESPLEHRQEKVFTSSRLLSLMETR